MFFNRLLRTNAYRFSIESITSNHSNRFQKTRHFRQLENTGFTETADKVAQILTSKLNFKMPYILHLKNADPLVFTKNQNELGVEKWIDFMQKEFGMQASDLRFVLTHHPPAARTTTEFYLERVKLFKKALNIERDQAIHILKTTPVVFFKDIEQTKEIKKILMVFFNKSSEEINDLTCKYPLIYLAEASNVKANLYKLTEYGFSPDELYGILSKYSIFLLRKVGNMSQLFLHLEKLEVSRRTIIKMCTRNPHVFSIFTLLTLLPKIKMFSKFGFRDAGLGAILSSQSSLLLINTQAIEEKLDYLFKFYIEESRNPTFIARLLMKNFGSFIKPRGDIMLKKKKLPWIAVLEMSDQEFCKETGITVEHLNSLKKPTAEYFVRKIPALKSVRKELIAELTFKPSN